MECNGFAFGAVLNVIVCAFCLSFERARTNIDFSSKRTCSTFTPFAAVAAAAAAAAVGAQGLRAMHSLTCGLSGSMRTWRHMRALLVKAPAAAANFLLMFIMS